LRIAPSWLGTQAPDALLMVAKIAGLAVERLSYNCFGRRFRMGGCHGELEQAVTIAKALNGRPVKVLWSREEDLAHVNGYHPMGVAKLTAALGADGMPVALRIRVAGNDALEYTPVQATIPDTFQASPLIEYGPNKVRLAHQLLRGFHLFPYAVPNLKVEVNTMKTFVPCSTWRSTGSYANVFYLESFIEELAREAGKDPVDYRRALIAAARPESFEDNAKDDWLLALNTVAEKAGWGRALPRAPASALRWTTASRSRSRYRACGAGCDRVRDAVRRVTVEAWISSTTRASDHQPGCRRTSGPRHDGLGLGAGVQPGDHLP
jgi:isoquinoline 1-oxidoreductase beta subunit